MPIMGEYIFINQEILEIQNRLVFKAVFVIHATNSYL